MSKRIVIVDDSIFLNKQLTAFMEVAMDCKVVGTGSGVMQALEEIMEEKPDANVMMISAIRGPKFSTLQSPGMESR